MKYWVYCDDGYYIIRKNRMLIGGWNLVGLFDTIELACAAITEHENTRLKNT